MHFWIDKRSNQLHHYGRRPGRPGPGGGGFFYGGSLSGHANHHPPHHRQNNSSSSSVPGGANSSKAHNSPQPQQHNPVAVPDNNSTMSPHSHHHHHHHHQTQRHYYQQPINHPSTSLNFNSAPGGGDDSTDFDNSISRRNTSVVTPVHRFGTTTIDPTRDQNQSAYRLNVAATNASTNMNNPHIHPPSAGATLSGFPIFASAANRTRRSSFGGLQHPSSRSRSHSRERSSATESSRSGRRRSSGSRMYSRTIPHDDTVTPSELQQLTSGVMLGQHPAEDQNSPLSSPIAGGNAVSGSSPLDQQPQVHLLHGDPKWNRTKRIGLSLCFMAFILMGTVGAKFIVQGPSIIDSNRRGQTEETAYFFFSELLFVAFAMALFFTGVACLRNRTNDYLLRQFNQHILSTSARAGVGGGAMNDFIDYYDTLGRHNSSSVTEDEENPENVQQQNHHHPHSHPSELLLSLSESRVHQHHHHHNSSNNCRHSSHFNIVPDAVYGNSSSGGYRGRGVSGRQGGKPPPYHIALYLPLPSQEYADTVQNPLLSFSDKPPGATDDLSSQEKSCSPNDPEMPETPPPSYDQFKFDDV